MKLLDPRRHSSAISLIECLAYIALFMLITGLAFGAYHHMDRQTRGLMSNASDIAQALRAGERWRADTRHATAVRAKDANAMLLKLPSGDVRYTFRDGGVWRQAGDGSPALVLERVKSSAMQADPRARVEAWRWELELKTKRVEASVRPLFTFMAVPGTEVGK